RPWIIRARAADLAPRWALLAKERYPLPSTIRGRLAKDAPCQRFDRAPSHRPGDRGQPDLAGVVGRLPHLPRGAEHRRLGRDAAASATGRAAVRPWSNGPMPTPLSSGTASVSSTRSAVLNSHSPGFTAEVASRPT